MPPRSPLASPLLACAISLGLASGQTGCVSSPDPEPDRDATREVVVAAESPWQGLEAGAAVAHFLDLTNPYTFSNTYLIGSLAESYDASLAPAVVAALREVDHGSEDADRERFLLVRVGCRWAYRFRGSATASLADERLVLLAALGDGVEAIDDATYRSWLGNIEEDRACLAAISALPSAEPGGAP